MLIDIVEIEPISFGEVSLKTSFVVKEPTVN
jgi:hypothetical protein